MSASPVDSDEDGTGPGEDAFAVVVSRTQGRWVVDSLPEELTDDLDGLIAAVRGRPGESGAFALVDVADEFFVVVRVLSGQVQLLLSDVSAAGDWDLAEQVVDHLDLELPDDDLEVEPAGDLTLFADLGLDARELASMLDDDEAYADEMLGEIAGRLGFGEQYERVVDALVG